MPASMTPGPLTEAIPERPWLSDRSLAAVVVRSSMIAISTIASAGDRGRADVLHLERCHDRLAEARVR